MGGLMNFSLFGGEGIVSTRGLQANMDLNELQRRFREAAETVADEDERVVVDDIVSTNMGYRSNVGFYKPSGCGEHMGATSMSFEHLEEETFVLIEAARKIRDQRKVKTAK